MWIIWIMTIAVCFYYGFCYDAPILWIRRDDDWQDKSLRYLFKPVTIVKRVVRWLTRKSAPRWGRNVWKSKT
jgi:hypothetical protein